MVRCALEVLLELLQAAARTATVRLAAAAMDARLTRINLMTLLIGYVTAGINASPRDRIVSYLPKFRAAIRHDYDGNTAFGG